MAARLARFLLPLSLLIVNASISQTRSAGLTLTKEGRSACTIVLAKNASASARFAGVELQRYLSAISGANVPISATAKPGSTIWIGSAGHSEGCPREIDWDRLGDDGFTIRTDGKNLIIAGGRDKGPLYGVYSFLESYLGCRKFSPMAELVPQKKTIVLPPINDTQVPRFTFRDAHFIDSSYVAWHKLDNHRDLFGLYVHTFARLVPPEVYFKDHPEYFTRLAGGRVPDAQLCLTNPDVFRIVVERLREHMRAEPGKIYWSVSQNDTFSPCECDACRAIDSVEGSPSGSLLAFVNKVAGQFPDKVISTLAYQYSRAAPRHIKPRENVNIMLCSIECNRSRPLETDSLSASFRKDLETWTSLTTNIYLWDYVVQFRNLISPFPNLRVLRPNIQYFAKNGITHIFEQGAGSLPNEFKELRTYLIAKLLWNPGINIDSVMNDFLSGYYGNAAPYLRRYIDTMHDSLAASGGELGIYGFPLPSKQGYLSPPCMDIYTELFDKAEQAVQNNPEILKRVQTARLPLQFATLEQGKLNGTGPRGFFQQAPGDNWVVSPAMRDLLDLFVARCKAFNITALNELGTTPDNYLAATEQYLRTSMKKNFGLFRSVSVTFPASKKYHEGDESALTDGLRGLDNYNLNWLGFYGVDMEATIDLGARASIRKVETGFLQDINAWIFLPESVEIWISDDGEHFVRKIQMMKAIPQNRRGIWSVPFTAEFEPIEARYVRVKAANLKTCPGWHKGAGQPCWVFADEIIIE